MGNSINYNDPRFLADAAQVELAYTSLVAHMSSRVQREACVGIAICSYHLHLKENPGDYKVAYTKGLERMSRTLTSRANK